LFVNLEVFAAMKIEMEFADYYGVKMVILYFRMHFSDSSASYLSLAAFQ
jgi:hypothetical protein